MTEPAPDPAGAPLGLLDRRRLTLVFALLVVELVIFAAGLLIPASASTRQALVNQTNSQFGPAVNGTATQLTGFIFEHNLQIALLEMIPIAGALLFGFSIYTTGLAAQALVLAKGEPVLLGAVIFGFPYSLVELSAYALAVAAGTMLMLAWSRHRLRRELRLFILEGAAVAAILLVAAAMEAITVRVSVLLGFALWLPTGLGLALLVVLAERGRL